MKLFFKNAQNYEMHWDIPAQKVFENARFGYYTRPFGPKACAVLSSSPQDNYYQLFYSNTKFRVNGYIACHKQKRLFEKSMKC